MGNPTLREGMQSADGWVWSISTACSTGTSNGRTDFKFYKDSSDGVFDAKTKAAVEQYQRDKGFTGGDVDGVVGDKTWSALRWPAGVWLPPAPTARPRHVRGAGKPLRTRWRWVTAMAPPTMSTSSTSV